MLRTLRHRILLLAFFACCIGAPIHAQTAAAPAESRKTSEPYTGDLSVFDSPGRERRLQIDPVIGLLGTNAGKTIPDIGAGSGGFSGGWAHGGYPGGRGFSVGDN